MISRKNVFRGLSWGVLGLVCALSSAWVARPTLSAAPETVAWPLNLTLLPYVSGLMAPTSVTYAPDNSGRIFVTEQGGAIRIIKNGMLLPTPFLTVNSVNCGKGGLLSMAFPADYAATGVFYVDYVAQTGECNQGGNSVYVSRFRVSAGNADVADPNTEEVLLVIPKNTNFHNGGQLAFSPTNGYLYVGVGDDDFNGGNSGNSRNMSVRTGKILRYQAPSQAGVALSIPPSNPFTMTKFLPEIWAYGVRNPYHFSFDRATGDLYLADVGDGGQPPENLREEINVYPATRPVEWIDFGWNIWEGFRCRFDNCSAAPPYFPPVLDYSHLGDRCAVMGGVVYRGSAYPTLTGMYFYSDFCQSAVAGLKNNGAGWETRWLTQSPGYGVDTISAFGEDQAGEVYAAGFNNGLLYRLVDFPQKHYLPFISGAP